MSEKTNIGWTNSTGGPWLGCTEVSAGCSNCYARELTVNRLAGGSASLIRRAYKVAGFGDWETRPAWGRNATRVLTKGFWADARRLNVSAPSGHKMFPSMIDWLDDCPGGMIAQDGAPVDPDAALADFLRVVRHTPRLTWILCTKRIDRFVERLVAAAEAARDAELRDWIAAWLDGVPPANVWLLATVESFSQRQRCVDLLRAPAAVRGISMEPLLEFFAPIMRHMVCSRGCEYEIFTDNAMGYSAGNRGFTHGARESTYCPRCGFALIVRAAVDWVIVGGESGGERRDCGASVIERAADNARFSGAAVFVKQDSAYRPGQRGRLSDAAWSMKQFPKDERSID